MTKKVFLSIGSVGTYTYMRIRERKVIKNRFTKNGDLLSKDRGKNDQSIFEDGFGRMRMKQKTTRVRFS